MRLSLDDFETGYASLHNLQALPFDEIKIDMSFVRSMLHDRERQKIVAAIVGLGHSLGLVTVAEGIQERAQAAMLMRMGFRLRALALARETAQVRICPSRPINS